MAECPAYRAGTVAHKLLIRVSYHFLLSLLSLSLLPAEPKIFRGREVEVEQIKSALIQEPARIAILGPGGIGKTSLARVVLHHPDITAKYQHRFFVTSESATTSSDLASLIGSTLDLKQQGKSLTTAIIQYFSDKPLCLLILDNLETPWESADSRGNVEEFLALLTDISNLALIVSATIPSQSGQLLTCTIGYNARG